MNLLRTEKLCKNFHKKSIIKDINFTINDKEIIGLVGKSGCGKSVFIKLLIGFYLPSSGEIIRNNDVKIGFSMQNNSLYENLTAYQNLKYFCSIISMNRKTRKLKIESLLKDLYLEEYRNVLVKNLSGGTKKRLDIACALINDPDIIILDEPLVGLDPEEVKQISEIIINLNKKGKTILLSSHIIDELTKICTDYIVLKDKKLYRATPQQVKLPKARP